jgi:tRNA pseudouridine38-40 synthase
MRNLKLLLDYDGTDFCGWQVQPRSPSVQGELSSAIGRLTGENVLPQGSGRTDAGVHALAQVANFKTASSIPTANLVIALNDILPASIRVLEATEVSWDFHARKSAKSKTYRYRIYRPAICPPFLARYVWHYPYPLRYPALEAAAPLIEGEHDFTSFASVDAEKPSQAGEAARVESPNLRAIYSSRWRQEGDEFVYEVCGNGFLHHMVRNLIGTYLLIGKGSRKPSDMTEVLALEDRSAAGATAPAQGLYLVNVDYGG